MKTKNINTNQNGVTLVALAVTIVILIMLAGITISGLMGENGIINASKKQKEEAEEKNKNRDNEINSLYDDLADDFEEIGIELIPNTLEWTNQDVIVQVKYGSKLVQNKKAGIGEATEENATEITLTQNGTVCAEAEDRRGTKHSARLQIRKIDKNNPTTTITKSITNSESITIAANATDTESGIASDAIYNFYYKKKEDNEYIKKQSTTSKECTFTELIQETEYDIKVEVKDNAGNIGVATQTIKTINVPSGLVAGVIQWSKVVWSNGKASTKISTTQTNYTIQYLIDSTNNMTTAQILKANWVNGNTVNNIPNNSTVYARLWDGTNAGKYASIAISDNVKPTLTIAKTGLTSNIIKVQVTSKDDNSGIPANPQYKYYIKKTADATYPATPKYIGNLTEYTFAGLEEVVSYDIKVTVLDNANNEGSITIEKTITQSTVPTLEIIKDRTQSGVASVIVTANGAVEDGTINQITRPDNTTVLGNSTTYTITKNGNYTFKVTTVAGKETVKTFNIHNIKEIGKDVTGIATGTEISHTHAYVNNNDTNKHWEECSICGTKRNEVAHSFDAGYWTMGDSCTWNNNFIQKCSCGYSKIMGNTRAHRNLVRVTNRDQYTHYDNCMYCGYWTNTERCYCYNSSGQKVNIDCNNYGTCVVCNNVYTKNNCTHYGNIWDTEGVITCFQCNTKIAETKSHNIQYMGGNQWKVTAVIEVSHPYNNYYGGWVQPLVLQLVSRNVQVSGNLVTVVTVVNSISDRYQYEGGQVNSYISLKDSDGTIYNMDDVFYLHPEYEAPTIASVNITNQGTINGWSTGKTFNITGTENYCKDVTIDITDNSTGAKILNGAKVAVNNKNYSYTFTPNIEVGDAQKTYTISVQDSFRNTRTTTTTLSKVDRYAPTYMGTTIFNSNWSTSKDVTFSATDNGAGGVQISFNNNSSYESTTNSNGTYSKTYHLIGDVYANTAALVYMKDAIGNERTQRITIGKIDNTSPTITNVTQAKNGSDINITVTANDINTMLNQEGSGITGYAISRSKEEPENYQTSNVLTVTQKGTYYIFVKDNVGNVSTRYEYVV